MRAIDSVAQIKKVRVKANSEPWFDSEIISAIQKRVKLYSRYKMSSSETDKEHQNYFFENRSFFEEKLVLNCKNPKGSCKTLKGKC